jgi:hypothetical protein
MIQTTKISLNLKFKFRSIFEKFSDHYIFIIIIVINVRKTINKEINIFYGNQ